VTTAGTATSYPPYAPPYTAADLTEDAVGILDAYGIEPAHAWGISRDDHTAAGDQPS